MNSIHGLQLFVNVYRWKHDPSIQLQSIHAPWTHFTASNIGLNIGTESSIQARIIPPRSLLALPKSTSQSNILLCSVNVRKEERKYQSVSNKIDLKEPTIFTENFSGNEKFAFHLKQD